MARALWGPSVPFLVADALDQIARFGTPVGRDALLEAARDAGADTTGWQEMGPVDLAAMLLADPVHKVGVFARAHVRLAGLPPERPTYELRAERTDRVPEPATLARELGPVAGGPWGEVWARRDEQGTLHAVLLHAAPVDEVVEVDAGGPSARVRRGLRADAFRLIAGEGRLVVTTARPMLLRAYAEAWGRALYGDAGHFLDAPSLTLKPLQALGARGLSSAKLPRGLLRVAVIACQLDTGKAGRLEARGRDALARLAPQLRAGGHLTAATLRFAVDGQEHPLDVRLEIPDRLTVGPADASGGALPGKLLAREAIAGLGLLSPGTIADDVTTLLPLVHPEWRWRALVGDGGLAAMRERGVLSPVRGEDARRPASVAMRRVGRSAIAYRIYPERAGDPRAAETMPLLMKNAYYAVADDWSIPAMSIDVSAMGMLRLRLDAVVRGAARELGLSRGSPRPPPSTLPRGVLWVGDLRVASGVVRFFFVVRAVSEERERAAVGRAIARATGFGRAVVFVPRGRRLGRDCVELELDVREQLGAASWRGRLAEGVAALGLEEEVPAHQLVPEGVRLVIETRRERAVLDGVPLTALAESGYRLLRALAGRGEGELVPVRELDRAISGARGSDGTTRKAAWKLKAWIEQSFAEANVPVPADVAQHGLVVASPKKGWKLTVRGAVR